MNFKTTISLLLVLLCVQSFAQKKGLESISENDLKAHLEFIASDYMQGRDFNTDIPGLEITADYLRSQCKKMGLKDGGQDYFQAVEMIAVKPDAENTFVELKDKNGAVTFKSSDVFSFGATKNDTIAGDVIFAGYGWYNDKTKYNDTKGLDIKGKVVLVMTRNLEAALDTSKKENDTNTEMKKVSKAAMGGAKALILVPDPMNPDKNWFNMVKGYVSGGSFTLKGAKGSSRLMPIKILLGTEELANQIVKESGKTLAELQKEINETASPKSFEVKNVSINVQLAQKTNDAEGKNVVAIVEGSDPVLKNECIVFSAHYDHLGVTPDGKVNNGADDNGTGTVALLEIAEAFTKMKKKPKRSIVFAWVTAEEKGLIGSDYYSQNPVIPLENTVVDINLDMVGRSAKTEPEKGAAMNKSLAGPNGLYVVSGKQSSELNEISNKICKELGLIPRDDLSEAFLSRSDYFHFYKNGVPVLGLSTGLHDDYHKPSDELDKIDYTKMKRVAQFSFLVANEVANQKKRIVVDNPVKK